jgi:putative tricarboxylic transport membrane protein
MQRTMLGAVNRITALVLILVSGAALGAECLAPARPNGGFHMTCELLQAGLRQTHASAEPLQITHMPGGVGALTYNAVITERSAEPNTLVAFSGGSLLNIAQGRFGKYTERDVKWLAAIGTDYGVLIVRRDSPFRNLADLIAAMKERPHKITFGGDGTIHGQDWTKAAIAASAAKVSYKSLRFVGFEGAGDASSALTGGYVDVVSGDLSEAVRMLRDGLPLRILVVFSGKRLPGAFKDIPTAREAGYDIEWSNIRGVYMGPKVRDADYQRWADLIKKMLADPEFARLREEHGLMPLAKTGVEFQSDVGDLVKRYKRISAEVKLDGGKMEIRAPERRE